MKKIALAVALAVGCTGAMAAQAMGHMNMQQGKDSKPLPSPREEASVKLNSAEVHISYGAPSLRGRKMVGEHDPYGKVWRLGANEATSFTTTGDLMIGDLHVPAGKYTLYCLPAADHWTLIVNKQTGQWGTVYNQGQDLGRVEMKKGTLSSPQERMSIGFEDTQGGKTQMHVKWDKDDMWVPVTAM